MPRTRATAKPRKSKPHRARETKTVYITRRRDPLAHLRANERAALTEYAAHLRQKFPGMVQQKFFARMERYLRDADALD